MGELPALEGDYDEPSTSTSRPRTPTRYNIDKNLDSVDLGVLKDMGDPIPNDFFDTSPERLREIRDEVKNDVKATTGQIAGLKRKKNKKQKMKKWKLNLFKCKKIYYINTKTFLNFIQVRLSIKWGKE